MKNQRRLVYADEVEYLISGLDSLPWEEDVRTLVNSLSTADAVEVVHGRWDDFCRGKMCVCSACKAEFDNTCNDIHSEWKFCPNCGALMH